MMTISQSLLKSYMEYCYGDECGIVFNRKYITKDFPDEPTDAMKLGRYYEFLVTGYYNPKDGKPEPKILRSGKLAADYQRAHDQAERTLQHIKDLGFRIVESGKRIRVDDNTLVLDIIAERGGESVIIDLKYSGLVNNKWERTGWHLDTFDQNYMHHFQPMHYTLLTGMRFYYFVYSSKNDDCLLFEVVMPQPETNEVHAARLKRIRERIEIEQSTGGFIPRPSFKRCSGCPIKDECKSAKLVPDIESVEIFPTYDTILDS